MWWLFTRNSNDADRAKFRARLWMPPKGVAVTDKRSPWSPESETAALGALKAMISGAPAPAPTPGSKG